LGLARRVWKSTKRNAGYYVLLALRAAVGSLPAGARLSVGEALGSTVYRLAGRERRRALDSLSKAFGAERPVEEHRRIALECFRNLGRSVAELCGLWRGTPSDVLALFECQEARARLDSLLAGDRGLVVVTAHLDNWELLGAWAAAAGYPLTVVARRIYFEKYDRLVVGMRRRFGMEVIYQDESPRKLLRALRDGRILALLADQDVGRLDGVFVPFLGRPAYTPTGPVSLALAGRTPLVLGHTLRVGRDRHRVVVSEPIEFDRSEKRRALLEGTRAWTGMLEAAIRRWPEQWVWMHRRWRTRLNDRPEVARRSGYDVYVPPAPPAPERAGGAAAAAAAAGGGEAGVPGAEGSR
jgi:KDO2-lipid IV(A) lauroyltransferase